MSVESQEERTVEVSGFPEVVDEDLLSMYFTNKRRSGGGTLISLEVVGRQAVLVFEEVEAAARVLSKRPHVLRNIEMTVRKPASKDAGRMLLRGVNPTTSMDLVELYVENLIGLDMEDYKLERFPGKDLVLIHLHQPFSKDFQRISANIYKKPLDGCSITLEQIEQTDSILVENLHSGTTEDMLTLYFESKRGGGRDVKEATIMPNGVARVSFESFESVEHVLKLPHKLEDTELTVKPYLAFLQPEENLSTENTVNMTAESSPTVMEDTQIESISQSQPSSLEVASSIDQTVSNQTALEMAAASAEPEEAGAEVTMEELPAESELFSGHIPIPDPVKLTLLQMSPVLVDIQQAHPGFNMQVKDDGVHMSGPEKLGLEQLKNTILEFLGGIAQAHLTFDPKKARFLQDQKVKDQLLQTLNNQGTPCIYNVTDCVVVVSSLSLNLVSQACNALKSLISEFSISVDAKYESTLYSQECSVFFQSLDFCSATVSEKGNGIEVLTLKGMENKKKAKVVEFLSTPIERETVIPMEQGMLKYIQIHCHQLLADMDQVSIFPLEAEDICGLRIHGNVGSCQMADEVLREVISSVCTRTITVNKPGVARFLVQEEGTSILGEMQAKFQVYISLEKVHWEPLENEDIYEMAWKMTLPQNYQRVSLDGSTQDPTSALSITDNSDNPDRGLIEDAKKLFSAMDETVDKTTDMEQEDLYSAEEEMLPSTSDQGSDGVIDVELADTPCPLVVEQAAASGPLVASDGHGSTDLYSTLDEEAQLSLAIQFSMETANMSSTTPVAERSQLNKAVHMSLQDTIKAANTGQIFVFAGYSCDLIRVDIALGKKVTLRQVEEKMEHKSLKSLSEFHMRCLELIKRKHAVEIQIEGTTATISGFKDYVNEALPDMKLLMKRISSSVSDVDILKTVQWVWLDQGTKATKPYAPDVTVFIENAWKMRQKKIDIVLNNQPYIINFEKMEEHNVTTGKSVPITRKMLSSGDLFTELPEEDYSLLSTLPETSRVNEECDEFQDVVKEFYDSIQEFHNKIRIIKVEKLMNRLLFNQYKLKKASISQSATEVEVEQTLFHGTSESSVKEICIHGFNRSFCGKNATVYGQGVYFAVESALSVQDQYSPPNADGHKFVFVTKVLTGDFTKGSHDMKTAPLKENSTIPLRYDSVTDNPRKPSLFVIFNDTQAFPQYLITCQKIHR
ncbi:protein mono-ADP-ribosyltransferase PARP10 [Osmerus mordax]|uniref:protein mono-ADP-ribosyltransferase PARP10 n=1 Tax=Osmerus mordax TaxID=8014 RepID=UPI00350EE3A7